MQTISKEKIKAVNACLAAKGLMEDKKELIRQFTLGRTDRSSELTMEEANELLAMMNKNILPSPEQLRADKMARNIIAMARELGWVKRKSDGTSDYAVLDNWMLNKSYLQKKLNRYSYEELPKLVSQFKAVYEYYLKKN